MRKVEWNVVASNVDIHEEMNKALGLNNIKTNDTLVLTISKECHNHIKSLHETYPNTEWLAICKTEKVGNWHFRVVDMIHPQQKWVGAEVETTDEWMKWMHDYLTEHNEPLGQWNLVLHSHHHMWVFWSGTDDRARLWLNDGRDLMWAVVTAYEKKWKTMDITYKGCVNFYKPYNIEIDCHVEAEEDWGYEKLRKLYKKQKEREEQIKTRGLEIYEELLASEWVKVSFDNVKEYLGMDIDKELTKNYYQVSRLLPDADKNFYDNIEQQAIWQAINEIPWIDIPSDLLARDDWDNKLLKQLEEARNIPVVVKDYTSAYQTQIISEWKEKEKETETETQKETFVIDNDYLYFNEENFPDEYELRVEYGVPRYVDLSLDWNGIWLAYDRNRQADIPFGQWLEEFIDRGSNNYWYYY